MTDYNLGTARGKLEIDYDGSEVRQAIVDLDAATGASQRLEEQNDSTTKSLRESDKQFGSSGTAADGYAKRLEDVRKASADVDKAEKDYKRTLLDSGSTIDDVKAAHDRLGDAKKRHVEATNAERDAHRALSNEMSVGQRVMQAMSGILPNLERRIDRLATVSEDAERKTTGLARGLTGVASVMSKLGPEAAAVAGGFELAAKGVDKFSTSASAGGSHVRNFIRELGGFEVAFGKISGLSLGLPALGGLGAIGGAAGLQGIVEVADAVRQLSGALALLPAAAGGVGVVMGTMKIALHGVGDALKDMMADDPKKFLDDLKDMAPAAAHAMLQVAQFRDQFKLGGAAVQTSFFNQINADIQPLIQTWLPALVAGGSKVAGVLGGMADQFAKLLMQPQMMQAFAAFIDNISKGLQAMAPAMKPILDIFTQLAVVGSSTFQAIGGQITTMFNFFDQVVSKAAASGELQRFIIEGVNGIFHLINALYSFGAAFNHIMDIAERFGGGGLLAWIDKLGQQLNTWTQSAAGQKALTDFFTTLRQATDAFLPILGPLLNGIVSIGSAFTQLGIGIAPAWLEFFKTFAYEMQNDLGPAIVGMGPAINQFIGSMTDVFRQLIQTVGPQLPKIFQDLADAMSQLAPQIPQLVALFISLVESVGPQLPSLFAAVTQAIRDLAPLMPTIIGFVRDFVSIITLLIQGGDKSEQALATLANGIIKVGNAVLDALENKLGKDLPAKAEEWGKSLVTGLIKGMTSAGVLGLLDGATGGLVGSIAKWFQSSPAKVGPFSGSGYTLIRGQKMVTDMADGMARAQPAIEAAAKSTAAAASRALSSGAGGGAAAASGMIGRAGAPAAGGAGTEGGSLLPPWIARADTSILDRYLSHEFPKNRGLAGLAADMGKLLTAAQNGLNLVTQHLVTPLTQTLSLLGKIPALSATLGDRTWRKMTPQQQTEQAMQELQRKALQGQKQGPTWGQVLGTGDAAHLNDPNIPLGVSAASSKEDIQKAIIAAGRARGMNDAAIQTALAVAAAESGFNPTISGGVQGSAGEVLGLYQQSPSSGWGTREQVTDPNYAINKFYDAFAAQLAKNPTDPLLAAVLTQNPQLGAGAQGSQYMRDVQRQIGLAGSILQTLGPGVKGPDWQAITGGGVSTPGAAPITPPAGVPAAPAPGARAYGPVIKNPNGGLNTVGGAPVIVGPDGTLQYAHPTGPGAPPSISANPASRAGTLGGANANYTPATMRAAGIAPLFTKQEPGSMAGAPAWVSQLAAAFGLTASDHADTTLHGGEGQMGSWAFDFSGSVENMQRFANFIRANLASQTLQAIWQNPQTGEQLGIAGGQILGRNQYYTTAGGSYADHTDHVHWATDVPVLFNGQVPPGSMTNLPLAPGATPSPQQAAALAAGYPDVANALGLIKDNTGKSATVNDQLLQAYLQGNPALAAQIDAAKTPGANDSTVLSTLNNITTTINGLKAQDAVGNKNAIDALQNVQNQIAQQNGFTQGQGPVQVFSSVAQGASNIASSIIQAIQGGLDALTATQDIADRAVYGVRNSEDIMKFIDDVQKYIAFAADVANATGAVLSTIAGFVGAGSGSDPSGGAEGAAAALGAAGQIASLIGSALQGINAAIDFGQEVYHIIGTYVGRFVTQLTGLAGTPLMGDVHMELNKNTGQLIAYSADNPENKDVMNVPSFLNQTYDYGSGQNPNPQNNTEFNIYAGPGQSAASLLNESMWMVSTGGFSGGGTGAMSAANF